MSNRYKTVCVVVDSIVLNLPNKELRKDAVVHLYGVSQLAIMIATKRGLDPELASIAGLLHDLYRYQHPDCFNHALSGSMLARQLLEREAFMNDEEIHLICKAIEYHSQKEIIHGPLDEVLKDADALQHYLCSPSNELMMHWRIKEFLL